MKIKTYFKIIVIFAKRSYSVFLFSHALRKSRFRNFWYLGQLFSKFRRIVDSFSIAIP